MVKFLALIALIVSIVWCFAKPGFESVLAVIVSLSALVSAFLIPKRTAVRRKQQQSVSKSSMGIQAGRDVRIGDNGGDSNAG